MSHCLVTDVNDMVMSWCTKVSYAIKHVMFAVFHMVIETRFARNMLIMTETETETIPLMFSNFEDGITSRRDFTTSRHVVTCDVTAWHQMTYYVITKGIYIRPIRITKNHVFQDDDLDLWPWPTMWRHSMTLRCDVMWCHGVTPDDILCYYKGNLHRLTHQNHQKSRFSKWRPWPLTYDLDLRTRPRYCQR